MPTGSMWVIFLQMFYDMPYLLGNCPGYSKGICTAGSGFFANRQAIVCMGMPVAPVGITSIY